MTKFVRFFQKQKVHEPFRSLHGNMFREDIQRFMPHRPNRDVEKLTLVGDVSAVEVASRLLQRISRDGNNSYRLEFISSAIAAIALNLSYDGTILFEIVKDDNDEFELHQFTSTNFYSAFGYCIQIFPIVEWKTSDKYFNIGRSNDVWKIDLPKSLGGPSALRRSLKNLALTDSITPAFMSIEESLQKTDFDFSAYQKNVALVRRQATNSWHWNTRDYSDNHCTEAYTSYRLALFNISRIRLRDHILSSLNELFQRLNINSQIVLSEMKTEEDLRLAMDKFASGNLTLSEALDAFSIY